MEALAAAVVSIDRPVCFIDTETTSLRPDRRVWEWAVIRVQPDGIAETSEGFVMASSLDLGNADPMSLKIGRFYERHPQFNGSILEGLVDSSLYSEYSMAAAVERHTRDALIVGAVPNFDTEVLAAHMRAAGFAPAWHYHLIDVETLAAGQLGMLPPWNFDSVLTAYELVYDETRRHTAMGDAEMAAQLFTAVYQRAKGN
jgi:hypothetical protein